jgi:hypothetical protein
MARRLPIPKDLKHLIEKREKPDRRVAKPDTRPAAADGKRPVERRRGPRRNPEK